MNNESIHSEYELLDSGDFLKLEKVGPYRIVRPALQAVWGKSLGDSEWQNIDAIFIRKSGGEGHWQIKRKNLPSRWEITIEDLKVYIKLTDFGHIGIFPEQHIFWKKLRPLKRG